MKRVQTTLTAALIGAGMVAGTTGFSEEAKSPRDWLFTSLEMTNGKQSGWSNALHYFNGKYYITQECTTRVMTKWNAKHRGTDRLTRKGPHSADAMPLFESEDGVFWRFTGNIIEFGPDDYRDAWTELGANPVWHLDDGTLVQVCQVADLLHPDGKRRSMNEMYVSKDMYNWKRLPEEYNSYGNYDYMEEDGRWDHFVVVREPDGWYGLATTSKIKPFPGMNPDYHYTGLVFSKDGLKFDAIEPIPFSEKNLPGVRPAEISAWIKHGDTYYAATDNIGVFSVTRILSSANLKGPYRHRERNPLLTFTPWIRFCRTDGEWLACTYSPKFGGGSFDVVHVPLHQMAFEPDGTLRLKWWPKNEALKSEAMPVALGKPAKGANSRLADRTMDVERGFVVEGSYTVPAPLENIALGAAAAASHNPGHVANLTDGSMLRTWGGWKKGKEKAPAGSTWFELDFGGVKRLESMHIQWACRFNEDGGVKLKVETGVEPGQWHECSNARVWSLWNRAETPKSGRYLHSRYRNTDTITGIGAEARYVRLTVMSPWQDLTIHEIRAYSGNPFDTANCEAGVFLEYAGGNRMVMDGGLFQVFQDGTADFGDVEQGGAIYAGARMDRDRAFEGTLPFRLVVKDETALFYLDDELMRIVATPELSGRVGVLGDNVTNLRAWQAPEMK